MLRLRQLLSGRLAANVEGIRVTTDKVARARLPAAWAEAGLLHGDHGLPLWPTFEREVVGFPLGAHDDTVDALRGGGDGPGAGGPAGDGRPQRVRFG